MFLAGDRNGKAKLGTLLLLALIAGAGYYAFAFGSIYWRRYSLTDAVDGQLAYAGQLAEETIRQQIVDKIAAMNLPPAARRVRLVHTSPRTIQVSIAYTEKVNLLFRTKEIPVSITRRRTF